MPLIQGFEDSGDFTVMERLKTSVHVNLVFYLIVGSIGLVGLILLVTMSKNWYVVLLDIWSSFFIFILWLFIFFGWRARWGPPGVWGVG